MNFKRFALNDPTVSEFLNENYICTYKQISTFQVQTNKLTNKVLHNIDQFEFERMDEEQRQAYLSDVAKNRLSRRGGDVASFFLDPNGRVLEMVLGSVGPNRLLVSAQRAVSLNQELMSVRDSEQQRRIAVDHLREVILPEYVSTYSMHRSSGPFRKVESRDVESDLAEQDLRNAFLAAYKTINPSMPDGIEARPILPKVCSQRPFGLNSRDLPESALDLTARTDREKLLFCENLPLTEFPLADLQQVEKHMIQVLLGQPYTPVDEGYREKLRTVRTAFDQGKFTVLLLTDGEIKFAYGAKRQREFAPIPKEELMKLGSVRNLSEHFCIVELSDIEFFHLLSDLQIDPIEETALSRDIQKRGIGAVFVDSTGVVSKVLPSGTRPRVVGSVMYRFANATK